MSASSPERSERLGIRLGAVIQQVTGALLVPQVAEDSERLAAVALGRFLDEAVRGGEVDLRAVVRVAILSLDWRAGDAGDEWDDARQGSAMPERSDGEP